MPPATAAAPIPTASTPAPAAISGPGRVERPRPAIPRHAGCGAMRRRVVTKPSATAECPGAAAPLRRANPMYRSHRSCAGTRHSWACMPRSSGIGGSSAWQRCPPSTPSTAVRRSPASASSGQTRSIGPSIATALLRASNKAEKNEVSRRRPIFPGGCPPSIFGAGELNFRVRDGNGWCLSASVTGTCLQLLDLCPRGASKGGSVESSWIGGSMPPSERDPAAC